MKPVPIAYVTRWAATRGIVVMRGATLTDAGRLWDGFHSHAQSDWTIDRTVAEGRWRKALAKAASAAQKKADNLRAAAILPPKYTER